MIALRQSHFNDFFLNALHRISLDSCGTKINSRIKGNHRARLRLDIMEIVTAIAITKPRMATVLTTRDMNL